MYRFASLARLATASVASRTTCLRAPLAGPASSVSLLRAASAGVTGSGFSKLRLQPATALFARAYSSAGALSRQDIQDRIINLLRDFDKVNQDKLSEMAEFHKDLGLDSLDTIEVVMAIEEEFSVEIPDDEADEITSVKEAIEYISDRDDAH
ncbi:mitochondrial acyl carrier protein [Coemansia sp. BCRC 34490]|nr:mitochondrial acyl carrier protein [Coemansia sp. BCRC 34490]